MRERIIGQVDQIQELTRIAKVWKNPTKYESIFGQKAPHVILIVGAAGTGKTTIAERFSLDAAKTIAVPDEREFAPDFQGWVQHTVLNALSATPSDMMGTIAFFEDLDVRLQNAVTNREESPAEIFAAEMAVPKEKGAVVVTARSESPLKPLIDKGIFDRIIRLNIPTVRENEQIFEDYLLEHNLIKLDCAVIASLLHGKTVTDFEKALQMASETAFADNRTTVTTMDVAEACLRIAYDAHEITGKDKHRLFTSAYHEAGHSIVEEILRPGSVAVASIKTYHSGIAGVTCETFPDERWDTDLDQQINIRAMLAGKAAVRAKFNATDIGATSDIKMAKVAERRRVEKYEENGFHDLYPRAKDVGGAGTLSDDFDRKTRTILAKEYSEIVNFFSYDCVKECLDAVARALIERKTLLGDEVRAIMAQYPIAETCIAMFQIEQ